MRRWIVALTAIAILAGGPALAGDKGSANAGTKYPQKKTSSLGCGRAMKAGVAAPASGCVTAARCGHGHGVAACSAEMRAACGADAAGCPMPGRGFGPRRYLHSSHDPYNIWYRGPASRCTVAGWAHGGGRHRGPCDGSCGKMRAGMDCSQTCDKMRVRMDCSQTCGKMRAGMDCSQTCDKMRAGMNCCPSGVGIRGWTPWKSDCCPGAGKGACCPGGGIKG